jgi:hypothetical protein
MRRRSAALAEPADLGVQSVDGQAVPLEASGTVSHVHAPQMIIGEGFVVVIEPPRLTPADIKAIAQRFAARILAEAEHEGMISGVPHKEVPPRGATRRGRDRGK